MDEMNTLKTELASEIERIRAELFKQKESMTGMNDLLCDHTERDFHIDLWELSDRELDHEMGNRLSLMNDDIDTRPTPGNITSHRGIIGKPIVLIKRLFLKMMSFYTNTIFEKQRHFNAQSVAFHLASFIRFRALESRMNVIETKLKTLEEDMELTSLPLENLKNESIESHQSRIN